MRQLERQHRLDVAIFKTIIKKKKLFIVCYSSARFAIAIKNILLFQAYKQLKFGFFTSSQIPFCSFFFN